MDAVLRVGEGLHLRTGRDRIVYAGMPSDDIFSIVQRKRNFVPYTGWGYAWNLFFPKEQTDLVIDGVGVTVESVSEQEIKLSVG